MDSTSTACVTQDLGSSVTEATADDVVVSGSMLANVASAAEAVEITSSVTTTASITTTTTSGSQLPGNELLVIARTLSSLYGIVMFPLINPSAFYRIVVATYRTPNGMEFESTSAAGNGMYTFDFLKTFRILGISNIAEIRWRYESNRLGSQFLL